MTLFWVYAALLTALALVLLVTPLLRRRRKAGASASRADSSLTVFRDQLGELDADLAAGTIGRDQWEAARGDLQRGLLEGSSNMDTAVAARPDARSTVTAIVLAVAVPVIAVAVYLVLGSPQGLDPNRANAAQAAPHAVTQAQIEAMVTTLAQRLETNPDDIEGWVMLARTYGALGRFEQSAAAYAKAAARFPQDAQLLADYADSLAMAQGQKLEGKPEELIQRALQADGNNLKALALAGSVEFEKQNFAKASEYWKRILPLLPADSEMGNSVRASIKDAEDKQGGAPKSSVLTTKAGQGGKPKAADAPAPAAARDVRLSGTIRLAPALAARAAPEDTVFVLARPAQGSRMPLAAVRIKVKDLPFAFSFDDSMAMSQAAKLSDFSEVVVAARVSKSGNVTPERGDLEGASKSVHPGTTGLTVEIAKEVR
ncbi:MAG: c-type cytochrome biogenesis protein CcmI [Betaproteobacteria bacterium]|nr:MAG: c-type cytochrome biogenesis protein CcmI [Betaproteobacteria bacterium]